MFIYIYIYIYICLYIYIYFPLLCSLVFPLLCSYGMASVSRIDKIIGLFCKRDLCTRLYSAKETYNLIDPTNRSQPIAALEYNLFYRSLLQKRPLLLSIVNLNSD